ncbi:MAG: nuclear transport factor 2 family protein [Chitinophagales bacterium]
MQKMLSTTARNLRSFSQNRMLIKGKKALHDWWKDAFERLPTLSYEVIRLTAEEDMVFMEYIRHV